MYAQSLILAQNLLCIFFLNSIVKFSMEVFKDFIFPCLICEHKESYLEIQMLGFVAAINSGMHTLLFVDFWLAKHQLE